MTLTVLSGLSSSLPSLPSHSFFHTSSSPRSQQCCRMMRSPPAPMRPSDNYPPQPPPSQSSYPMPPISQRYLPPSKSAARPSDLPPRPGSSTSAASANLPPHPTVPLVQPQPHRPSNLAEERTFLPLVHTQMQAPGSGRKEEVYPASTQVAGRNAGREREQDSGESNPLLPATQPDSQLFSLNQSTQQQERGVLVPDASHRPRRLPRVPADPPGRPSHDGIPDLLGESLPPSSQLYDLGDTRIPETQHGTHHTQQEGAAYQLSTTKRIDTYHPPGPSRSAAVGRPANPWSMDGYDGGTRRPNSAIPRSAVDTGGANVSGRSTARPRGAAELFLAASQQQQQGGTKTNSEKIMDALSGALIDHIGYPPGWVSAHAHRVVHRYHRASFNHVNRSEASPRSSTRATVGSESFGDQGRGDRGNHRAT